MSDRKHFSRVPGGKYRCRRNDDGTYDIMDVEFFSTVPKGVKGAPKDITADDLQLAVDIHNRKFTEDRFLARVTVLHNYGTTKATGAGFFLPKRVGSMRLGGKSLPVIFADLISVPALVMEMIDRDELPYRSAEVREWEPLQFGALALLDTEPPFFEFPMLTTGEKIGGESVGHSIFRFDRTGEPAIAAFHSDRGSAYLFRFEEDSDMPDEKKKDDEDENLAAKMEDGGGMDVSGIVKAIESGEISVADMAAIVAAVESQKTELDTEPEMPDEPPTDGAPIEMSAGKKPVFVGDPKLEGRLAGLEQFKAQVEADRTRDKVFAAAVKSLHNDGFQLADSTQDKLLRAATVGEETLALFVEGIRETMVREPGQFIDGEPSDELYPAEVMKYAERGPDVFAAAKRCFRDHEELANNKTFRGTVSSLDRYLARYVQAGG